MSITDKKNLASPCPCVPLTFQTAAPVYYCFFPPTLIGYAPVYHKELNNAFLSCLVL
jgi:hypothetical protein